MRLLFKIKNQEILEIQLKKGSRIIDKTHLTAGQYFDIVLIRTLDKIICKHKINKLSLKSVKISGKIAPNAMFGMILQTTTRALKA